jgi:hypothetical protein
MNILYLDILHFSDIFISQPFRMLCHEKFDGVKYKRKFQFCVPEVAMQKCGESFYHEISGCAMGSPVSAVIVELVMQKEQEIALAT